jgi:hypothetical protein
MSGVLLGGGAEISFTIVGGMKIWILDRIANTVEAAYYDHFGTRAFW